MFHLPILSALLLLYAGPDQILPLLSVLGTVIGVLLVWWQRLVALIRKAVTFIYRRHRQLAKKVGE